LFFLRISSSFAFLVYLCCLPDPVVGLGIFPTKNPRLTGNRGFLENLFLGLKFPSRDATQMPNEHAAIRTLATLTNCDALSHFLIATN
jgi:hypothetical protein